MLELGNLDVARDFSDVRSVADAYVRLLEAPAGLDGTFNISSGRAVSLGEVVEMVSDISDHEFDVRVNPSFVRADEVRTLAGSHAALERAIGPLQQIPLSDTLQWMLEE